LVPSWLAPPGTPAAESAQPPPGPGRPTRGMNDRLPRLHEPPERFPRVKISPVARRLAAEAGLDPSDLEGSGPDGRIVRRDVEGALEARGRGPAAPEEPRAAAPPSPRIRGAPAGAGEAGRARRPAAPPSGPEPPPVPVAAGELGAELPHTRLRRAIAARMAESKRTVPHFYTTAAVRMDEALRLKDALALRAPEERVSQSHLLVKAAALALERYPRVSAVFEEDRIRIPARIDVGLAVAVEDGLIVPVLRDCAAKPLFELAREARAAVERVRAGKLAADDLQGATFTVSNMGMFEIEQFAAIIAPPQSAILAAGATAEQPVVEDGRVIPGRVLRLTLSADHRVIDGVLAAAFLVEVKRFLENPLALVI
jgi:pyruvate dehydrogenase E2 component (dihydrolipoamide acetyltransferase)